MDWMNADGLTVIQEARERFGGYNLVRCDMTTLRKLLQGDLVIVDLGSGKFSIMTTVQAKEANEFAEKMARELEDEKKAKRARAKAAHAQRAKERRLLEGPVMTDKGFAKKMREVAQDTVNDGICELDDAAYDLAECQLYDPDVQRYLEKHQSWAKTKQQKIEFIAELIHL